MYFHYLDFKCDKHASVSLIHAISYCSMLSCCYVGSLYVLVPQKIRKLNRDDIAQIQWRTMSTLVVCLVACITYPFLFCEIESTERSTFLFKTLKEDSWKTLISSIVILLHTSILYFGTIAKTILAFFLEQNKGGHFRNRNSQSLRSRSREERWILIRNYFVAPFTEEVIFRGCMVPVLLATKLTTLLVALIAPLFFGFAHLHHAIVKLQQGRNKISVLLETIFQFMYTSLFGFYASYAYIKTRSLLGVVLCHAFCNRMGFPNFDFLHPKSILYEIRKYLVLVHCIGIFLFFYSFKYNRIWDLMTL